MNTLNQYSPANPKLQTEHEDFSHDNFTAEDFKIVGANYEEQNAEQNKKQGTVKKKIRNFPFLSVFTLFVIILGCFFSHLFVNHDPTQFYLTNLNTAPDSEFWFGTDSLGRDIFSVLWNGGRASIFIGMTSTVIATVIGIMYGCISGCASTFIDTMMMRIAEMFQSIPIILTLLLLLSLQEKQTPLSISVIIGITSWFALARIVRAEVRQIRNSEYILLSRHMGASFFWIMRKHLIPNIVSAIMFIVISSISTNMAMEATLSFLGLGLPPEELSLGSMLALSNRALLLNTWWVIIFPGVFLLITLLCITQIGHIFRQENCKGFSNL